MNRFRCVGIVLVLCLGATMVAGCQSPPPPEPYSAKDPGPWKDVMPKPPKVTFEGAKIRIQVGYRSRPGDFVERVYLEDERNVRVGELAFGPGVEVEVAFTLPTGIERVVLYVKSSRHGTWRSKPIRVPPPK